MTLLDVANRDFHLSPDSPAIDTGFSTNAPTADFDGNLRDSNPDIGAYEYVSSQSDTTPPAAPSGLTVQ